MQTHILVAMKRDDGSDRDHGCQRSPLKHHSFIHKNNLEMKCDVLQNYRSI